MRELAQLPEIFRGQIVDVFDSRNRRHERPAAGGHDDSACGQAAFPDLDAPGRRDARLALDDLHPQRFETLHRIVGRDRFDDPMHPFHDIGEVEFDARLPDAVVLRALRLGQELGGTKQRLGGNATGIQAVAAHVLLLDQRHLRLDRGGNVGAHQAGRAGADYHHVALEPFRLRILFQNPARLDHIDHLLRNQREQSQQRERHDQPRGKNPRQGIELAQLRSRIYVHDRRRKHAQLTDEEEDQRPNRGQRHQQIDDEERKQRHQSQCEQVEGAVARHTGVDGAQTCAEAALHSIPKQEPSEQKRQRCADGGCEGHHHGAPQQSKEGTAGERHDGGARQGQRGDGDVDREVGKRCLEHVLVAVSDD